MEPLFITEWNLIETNTKEIIPIMRKSPFYNMFMPLTPIFIILSFIGFSTTHALNPASSIMLVLTILYILHYWFGPHIQVRNYFKKINETYSGKNHLNFLFYENTFEFQEATKYGTVTGNCPYSMITSITVTPSFYCFTFKLTNNRLYVISKNSFIKGTEQNFYNFLKDKYLLH